MSQHSTNDSDLISLPAAARALRFPAELLVLIIKDPLIRLVLMEVEENYRRTYDMPLC